MPRFRLLPVFLCATVGGGVGLGFYTFVYAKGYSYLSDDPATCANCHVMQGHLDGWYRGTHHTAATCNDCHLPESLAGKYRTKGSNGFWHSFYFTTGRFPDPIRIKPHNHDVVEANCRRCHGDIVDALDGPHPGERRLSCVTCHDAVGHG